MGTKNQPGEFDCYENAEPDEPMFILLARDKSAPELVEMWATLREATLGPRATEEDRRKIAEARQCAKAMRRWREEHRT